MLSPIRHPYPIPKCFNIKPFCQIKEPFILPQEKSTKRHPKSLLPCVWAEAQQKPCWFRLVWQWQLLSSGCPRSGALRPAPSSSGSTQPVMPLAWRYQQQLTFQEVALGKGEDWANSYRNRLLMQMNYEERNERKEAKNNIEDDLLIIVILLYFYSLAMIFVHFSYT